MPKGFELKQNVNRQDYYCVECKEITSIYLHGDGRRVLRVRGKPFCAWCGETIHMERHNSLKHGGVTGRRHWSLSELNLLKELLQQPLTWEQITERFEGKHTVAAVRKVTREKGWKKQYSLRGLNVENVTPERLQKRIDLTEEIKRKIASDPRSQLTIAKEYGIHKKTVWNIKRRYG